MKDQAEHCTFEELMDDTAPGLRPICIALREVIRTLHRDPVEVIWIKQGIASYGVGPRKMSQHYAYIAPQTKHVNLGFYHGASADDPADLLEGTGKRLRHVKITSVAEATRAQIKKLLAAAIQERKSSL